MSLIKAISVVPEMLIDAPGEADALRVEELVSTCAGMAFIKMYRLGCIVTIRGGEGVLVKRMKDGSWSAPSALTMMGIAVGASIGVELTDYIIFFQSEAQVDAFAQQNTGSVGLNGSIAVGPLGREGEAMVSTASNEGLIVFSTAKGLYGGVSLEFSGAIADNTANAVHYGRQITPREIFENEKPPTDEICVRMYKAFDDVASRAVKLQTPAPVGVPAAAAPAPAASPAATPAAAPATQ